MLATAATAKAWKRGNEAYHLKLCWLNTFPDPARCGSSPSCLTEVSQTANFSSNSAGVEIGSAMMARAMSCSASKAASQSPGGRRERT